MPLACYYADHFVLPLPDGHRFPMAKYRLLRERVASDAQFELHEAPAATDQQLLRCHTPDYLRRVTGGQLDRQEIRRLGFPWSPQLVERSRRSTGATIAATHAALREGAAANLAGGTHHAHSDAAEGFCVFNDCAVAAFELLELELASQVLIIDTDVHQGNGTAQICAQHPGIFTLSIHGDKNFPVRKMQSDLDIALPDGCEDERYLAALEGALQQIPKEIEPDFVFYLAGADAFEEDRLGRLSLSKEGLRQRDQLVVQFCRSLHLPAALCMGGGYATQIKDIVDIHFNSLSQLADLRLNMSSESNGF